MWDATQLLDLTLALGMGREEHVGSHVCEQIFFLVHPLACCIPQMDLESMSEKYDISIEQFRKTMVTWWKWYDVFYKNLLLTLHVAQWEVK